LLLNDKNLDFKYQIANETTKVESEIRQKEPIVKGNYTL